MKIRKTKDESTSLWKSFKEYRKLLILHQIINDCLQYYAMWIQVLVMTWVIISTAIVFQSDIRQNMEVYELVFFIATILDLYLVFFVVGYSFPGQANRMSKKCKGIWKRRRIDQVKRSFMIETGGNIVNEGKLIKRIISSFGDVRIRFGRVNFYGPVTPLVTVQFVVQKSIKLMLVL